MKNVLNIELGDIIYFYNTSFENDIGSYHDYGIVTNIKFDKEILKFKLYWSNSKDDCYYDSSIFDKKSLEVGSDFVLFKKRKDVSG